MSYRGLMNDKMKFVFMVLLFCLLVASCANKDPRKIDVVLQEVLPSAKVTSFTDALGDFGLMTQIYGTETVRFMMNPIGDNTGASASTGGEIPRDITEMMKSAINSIGGSVIYVPYEPDFMIKQQHIGYSDFRNKMIPDIVITGGITEFDRGLEVRGKNTDVGVGASLEGSPSFLPSDGVGLRYGGARKESLSRITLDLNMINFDTMSGIQKMNTSNTIEVRKVLADKELGISILGQTFGLKGSIRKVQGRHAAIRLLVDLNIIQIIGKHFVLPYWRLLGDDAQESPFVVEASRRSFRNMNESNVISLVQSWLYIYGHDVSISGVLDDDTLKALQKTVGDDLLVDNKIDEDTFVKVYLNIPINQDALKRHEMLTQRFQYGEEQATESESGDIVQTNETEMPLHEETKKEEVPDRNEIDTNSAAKKSFRKGIGRIIRDEEW